MIPLTMAPQDLSMPRLRLAVLAAPAVSLKEPPLHPEERFRRPDAARPLRRKAVSIPVPSGPEKSNPSNPPPAPCCNRSGKEQELLWVVSCSPRIIILESNNSISAEDIPIPEFRSKIERREAG
jgi:hypothetical protein